MCMPQALQMAKDMQVEKAELLTKLKEHVKKDEHELREACEVTFGLEAAVKAKLDSVGHTLPTQHIASDYYSQTPMVHTIGLVEFKAATMPDDVLIEQQLAEHLRMLISMHGLQVLLIAYTGIAWCPKKRWQTYRQCRTIFRRMFLWWHVVGGEKVEVAAAVKRLEAASIKVKEELLPKTNDKVFGNKVKFGGSGQSSEVLECTGYLLTLCRGELDLCNSAMWAS